MRTAPGRTPGIVRTLCRPFRAFRWFPIHKPSSNSTVPVAWIIEPATDSRFIIVLYPTLFKHLVEKYSKESLVKGKSAVITLPIRYVLTTIKSFGMSYCMKFYLKGVRNTGSAICFGPLPQSSNTESIFLLLGLSNGVYNLFLGQLAQNLKFDKV